MKLLKNAKNKAMVLAGGAAITALTTLNAFADETGVTDIIVKAGTDSKADAIKVIGAGVSLGVVFWGAKMLWSKFKSMAK
ncbi:MAG: hypothetical protein Q4A75_04335 [Peptostreptococcaceae bacterium]|nr:hypothetical protein [Peptostreptococcaceae bacterium]